jgi:hypothetical protein
VSDQNDGAVALEILTNLATDAGWWELIEDDVPAARLGVEGTVALTDPQADLIRRLTNRP